MESLRPQLDGMTRRLLLNFLAIDLLFEGAVGIGMSFVLGLDDDAERNRFILELAITATCMLGLYLTSLFLLLRPVDRWIAADAAGTVTREQLERVGRRLHRFPAIVTVLQTFKWSAVYAIVGLVHGGDVPPAALWLFVATFLLGPPPIAHTMAIWLTTPAIRRHSLAVHAAGLPDTAPPRSLRTLLAGYSLCLCLAPAMYMASVVFAAHENQLGTVELAIQVGSFFIAIAIFALVCAALLADTITTPISAMAEVIRQVARSGFVGRVHRIPAMRRDELGGLTELTNHMLDALARTEVARREASHSLAELNATLEARVVERTSSLVEANAALAGEMRMRAMMEAELRQAQKLESVGRLAAGIAHEINTPVQFVGDSLRFAREGVGDLRQAYADYQQLLEAVLAGAPAAALAAELRARADELDLGYVIEQLPQALDRALDGVGRVGGIVRSVKQFASPDRAEMAMADLNLAVASTVAVAVSEYKHVADVEKDLGEIPQVLCHVGEINQVVLNLIVNAAHAIGDVVTATGGRGRITIRTSLDRDHVVIEIGDTGCGIPEELRPHIFDVFFTTKEVGRGTGQGLAIARSVVVEKHGGQLTFDTEVGAGTRFFVRLPVAGPIARRVAA